MPVFSVGNRLSVPRAGAGHWVPGFPSLFVFLSGPPRPRVLLLYFLMSSLCIHPSFVSLSVRGSPSVSVTPPSVCPSLPPADTLAVTFLTHCALAPSVALSFAPSLHLTHTHILFHDVSHTVRFSLSRSFSPSLSPPFSSSPLFSPFRLPHSLFILVPPPPSFLPPLTLSSDVSPLFLWPCPSASFSRNLTHSLSLGASFFLLLAVFLPCPIHAALCRPPFCLTSLCQLLPSAPKAQGGGGTELFRQLLSPRAGDSRPPIVGLCSLAPGAWPPCPIHVPGLQSRFSPRRPRLLLPGARIWISIVRGRTRFADLARKRAMPSPPCPGTPCFRAALGCLHPSGRAPRLPPTGRPALVSPATSLRPPFRCRPSSRPATSPGSPPPASAGCL